MKTKQITNGIKYGLLGLIFVSFLLPTFTIELFLGITETISIADLDYGITVIFIAFIFIGVLVYFNYIDYEYTNISNYIVMTVILIFDIYLIYYELELNNEFGSLVSIKLNIGAYLLLLLPIIFILLTAKDEVFTKFVSLKISEITDKQEVATNTNQPSFNFHQLKELKELLDMGALTEDEFNNKKKELLGGHDE